MIKFQVKEILKTLQTMTIDQTTKDQTTYMKAEIETSRSEAEAEMTIM